MKRIAALLFCIGAALPAGASLSLAPRAPAAGEDFVVAIGWSSCDTETNVAATLTGSLLRITVSLLPAPGCFGVPPGRETRKVVRIDTPGTYCVEFERTWPGQAPAVRQEGCFELLPARATAAPAYRNLGGLWWDPQNPGEGLNVTQGESGNLFAFWYTYSEQSYPDGSHPNTAAWQMISTGRWVSPTEFVGPVHNARGPPLAQELVPGSVQPTLVTMGVIRAEGPDALVFERGFDPPRRLTRFRF